MITVFCTTRTWRQNIRGTVRPKDAAQQASASYLSNPVPNTPPQSRLILGYPIQSFSLRYFCNSDHCLANGTLEHA